MIIADLNHLDEVVSGEVNIVGSNGNSFFVIPYAQAKALSKATAIGTVSASFTYTETAAVSGLFSSSESGSESTSLF